MTASESAGITSVDDKLFELLGMTLADAGYAIEPTSADGIPAILAENPDNVVLATATLTVRDLVVAEAALSQALVDRVSEAPTGGKRWDGYVAVLTSQAAEAEASDTLFALTYNLRHLRRLVKVGVEPTIAAVRRAMRTLLPLGADTSVPSLGISPIDRLVDRLLKDGIEEEVIQRALARFKVTGFESLIEEDPDA